MKMFEPEYEMGLTFRQKLALEWLIFKVRVRRLLGML